MSEAKTINLYEKIQAVASDLISIEKDMMVGVGKNAYKAVSDLSVTKKVKELEQKHKLISIPQKQEMVSSEVIKTVRDGYEKITYSFIVKLTTRIVDIETPSDYLEVESFGHGLDSGDKGFGKASTYARKYALLNVYKIATGEDPDQAISEQQSANKTIDDKKKAVFEYLEKNNQYKVNILQHFSVEAPDYLDDKQLTTIYSNLKKKNLL